jgi:hypothetical protein
VSKQNYRGIPIIIDSNVPPGRVYLIFPVARDAEDPVDEQEVLGIITNVDISVIDMRPKISHFRGMP